MKYLRLIFIAYISLTSGTQEKRARVFFYPDTLSCLEFWNLVTFQTVFYSDWSKRVILFPLKSSPSFTLKLYKFTHKGLTFPCKRYLKSISHCKINYKCLLDFYTKFKTAKINFLTGHTRTHTRVYWKKRFLFFGVQIQSSRGVVCFCCLNVSESQRVFMFEGLVQVCRQTDKAALTLALGY